MGAVSRQNTGPVQDGRPPHVAVNVAAATVPEDAGGGEFFICS